MLVMRWLCQRQLRIDPLVTAEFQRSHGLHTTDASIYRSLTMSACSHAGARQTGSPWGGSLCRPKRTNATSSWVRHRDTQDPVRRRLRRRQAPAPSTCRPDRGHLTTAHRGHHGQRSDAPRLNNHREITCPRAGRPKVRPQGTQLSVDRPSADGGESLSAPAHM
jgi:hypothetical protein